MLPMLSTALQLVLSFAVQIASACVQTPAVEEPALTCEGLLAALRSDELDSQMRTMRAFAAQSEAPQAIPRLLEEMRRSAPELDNNVGLAVGFILEQHPEAECPLEPLLEAIARPHWTSQQKCAQALLPLLARGDGDGREHELAARLIPLLASQRPRVFEAARKCLEALTSEALGDRPEGWLDWYERETGRELDMSHAVHEELVVVRPLGDGRFGILGEEGELDSLEELRAALLPRVEEARERGLALAASIQLANERFGDFQALIAAPDVAPLLELVLRDLAIPDLVLSPMSDAFRAPWARHSTGPSGSGR